MAGDGNELANRIAKLVEEKGWNQEDFARSADLNRHTVRQILHGGPKRRLRNATVSQCAAALGLTVDLARRCTLPGPGEYSFAVSYESAARAGLLPVNGSGSVQLLVGAPVLACLTALPRQCCVPLSVQKTAAALCWRTPMRRWSPQAVPGSSCSHRTAWVSATLRLRRRATSLPEEPTQEGRRPRQGLGSWGACRPSTTGRMPPATSPDIPPAHYRHIHEDPAHTPTPQACVGAASRRRRRAIDRLAAGGALAQGCAAGRMVAHRRGLPCAHGRRCAGGAGGAGLRRPSLS